MPKKTLAPGDIPERDMSIARGQAKTACASRRDFYLLFDLFFVEKRDRQAMKLRIR